MKIHISGLYGGTNPQPGVGIARSLRMAYPAATLVGVEYSNRCSGIHWQDLDEIRLQRPWHELDLATHAAAVKEVVETGGLWISGIDLEIMWLGTIFPDGHPNLLIPTGSAVRNTAKPAIPAHEGLPVKIPNYVTTALSDWDLHTFCRRNDWKVWLKGPYYEAVKTRNWAEFETARNTLSKAWSTERLFVQTHINGYEESITLAAYRGELLDCAAMRKRDLTEMNKTWAGEVGEVPEDIIVPLRRITRDLKWSGGAELEMVRDADNQLWLLEWNPRFPAWIHGATIAGYNLPALLIEAATGSKAEKSPATAREFTRVVVEIPVREEFPLAPLPEPLSGAGGHSLKHPSGLVEFANRFPEIDFALPHGSHKNGDGQTDLAADELPFVPPLFQKDIAAHDFARLQTPAPLFLAQTAAELFARNARFAAQFSTREITVSNAYSLKTNPDARLLQLANEHGFLAETISPHEINKARENGFPAERVILNGPGKWWHSEYLPPTPLHAVFCDSIADCERLMEGLLNHEVQTKTLGVRLRAPHIASRFGIPLNTPEDFQTLIKLVGEIPRDCGFGVHFHLASSNIGVRQWWHLLGTMVKWCASLEVLAGRRIECLDIGGGWFPDDWEVAADEKFAEAVALIGENLPHVRQIILEPGKALAQPSMALAMRILEIQSSHGKPPEAIVDASIAELPMSFLYPHRILYQDSDTGNWQTLGRGKSRLLGRLCMEHDIIGTNVGLPENTKAGDVLVFCDAGAYDRSMSYVFGCG